MSRTVRSRVIAWSFLVLVHATLAAWYAVPVPAGLPIDDAFIHLVYGRALVEHGSPQYNDGATETGFTSPAWIAVAAVAEAGSRATDLPAPILLKALGTAFGAACSVLVFELVLALAGSLAAAAAAGLLCALDPSLAFAQVSGMEVPLAAALALGAALALSAGRTRPAGLLLALALLARPEMAVLVVLAAATLLLSRSAWADPGGGLRQAATLLGPVLLAGLAWSLFCLAASGHPFPATAYAKVEGGHLGTLPRVLGQFALLPPVNRFGIGLLICAAGVVTLVRGRLRGAWVIVLFPWLFVAAIAATRWMPIRGMLHIYWLRYPLPALPFLFVALGCGIAALSGRGAHAAWRGGLTALALAASLWPVATGLSESRFRYVANCRNIENMQVAAGRWLDTLPGPTAVLVNDAGAIRYFGRQRTIDLIGLNSKDVLFAPGLQERIASDPFALRSFMDQERATYLIVFPDFFPRLTRSPRFRDLFEEIRSFRNEAVPEAALPASSLPVYAPRGSGLRGAGAR